MSISVDNSRALAGIKKLSKNSKKATNASLDEIADEILRLSQIEVPHDTGYLASTGVVDDGFSSDERIIGYHTPYAARLHEHPEYRFQKGRKGKYLEDPIERNQRVLGIKFSRKFESGIK